MTRLELYNKIFPDSYRTPEGYPIAGSPCAISQYFATTNCLYVVDPTSGLSCRECVHKFWNEEVDI